MGDTRIEVDGRPATLDLLPFPAATYGHFTAMQVRGGRTRGLPLHLARLDTADRELFGAALDGELVRGRIRHLLEGGAADASVRVYVVRPEPDREVSVIVTARPPAATWTSPVILRSVDYQRTAAHIKRIADFGQTYHREIAEHGGADDALLTGPDGVVSECSIANIAFVDENAVVWPDAPALEGITKQLLEPRLPGAGLASSRRPVRLADLPSFRTAFVTNARGIAPVGRIDDHSMETDEATLTVLREVYASVPWDRI